MAARELVPAELLDDVKNMLDITWSDPATDRKVSEYVAQGVRYLDGKAGEELDYTEPGDGRRLLFEYARYARDGALDVFETNYLSQILAMQNDRKVERYAAESISAE